MSHYDFTSITALSIFLTVGVILGWSIVTHIMVIIDFIVRLFILIIGSILLSPIMLLEFIIKGESSYFEDIRFKNKNKKLFDDW